MGSAGAGDPARAHWQAPRTLIPLPNPAGIHRPVQYNLLLPPGHIRTRDLPTQHIEAMDDGRSDRELAEAIVEDGDEAAFRVLYRRHTPRVYRFALRLVGGDVTEAEDVIQEAWLRAARSLARFRFDAAFHSWLCGIALNCVREQARRRGRSLVEVGGDGWEPPPSVRDPGTIIDLERALELLPLGFRTVLVLHDVEGFTHQEIGDRLGISDGTSKSQLHHARRAMRQLLGGDMEAGTA